MRPLLGLLVLLFSLTPPTVSADVVAGRASILFHDRWAPIAGGAVIPLGVPATSAAFDGERFLVGWRDGDVVWLALFEEGATVPFTRTSLDIEGTVPPIVRWNGSVFVVVCEARPTQIAVVSRQGIVESLKTLIATGITDVAASASGTALITLFETSKHAGVVDVLLLDNKLELSARTVVGSIIKSTGFGVTYIRQPTIVPFGEGFYAIWREGRTARYDHVVGTRVLLDCTAPETKPATREASSLTATVVEQDNEPPHTIRLHAYGPRLAAQAVREYGIGLTTKFVEPDGTITPTSYRLSTFRLPTNLTTVRLFDGSIIAAWIRDDGTFASAPLVPPLPSAPRRRSSRH